MLNRRKRESAVDSLESNRNEIKGLKTQLKTVLTGGLVLPILRASRNRTTMLGRYGLDNAHFHSGHGRHSSSAPRIAPNGHGEDANDGQHRGNDL